MIFLDLSEFDLHRYKNLPIYSLNDNFGLIIRVQ